LTTVKDYLIFPYALYIATQLFTLLDRKMRSLELDPEEREVVEALVRYVL
jgi:hypothetical protein